MRRLVAAAVLIGLLGCGGADAAPRTTMPLGRRLVMRLAHQGRYPVNLRAVRIEVDGAVIRTRTVDDAHARALATELYAGPIDGGARQMRVVLDYAFRYEDALCHYGSPHRASVARTIELAAAGDTVVCVRTGPRSLFEDAIESLTPRIDHDPRCAP